MKIVKNKLKSAVNKKGQTVNVYRILSEFNQQQRDPLKEKFDLKLSEIKKIHAKLLAKGKKFIIEGLNAHRMCCISDMAGNFIYLDSQEYLNGKDEGTIAFEEFSQLRITIYDE